VTVGTIGMTGDEVGVGVGVGVTRPEFKNIKSETVWGITQFGRSSRWRKCPDDT